MTDCLILAAGEGVRLRPYTNECPKGLVPFFGKPLISYQIDTLKRCDIQDIAIVTGYKAEKFAIYDFQMFHNKLFASTNMVESLFIARSFLEQAKGDVIISYGDIVFQKNNLESILAADGDIVVMIDDGWLDLWSARNENPLNDAETLKYGKQGQIIELGKKPNSLIDIKGQYTGLIKISHQKIDDFNDFYDQLDRNLLYDGKSFEQMYMTSFLQLLIDAGWMIMPAHVKHGWLELDTVEDLQIYEQLSLEGRLNDLWKMHD